MSVTSVITWVMSSFKQTPPHDHGCSPLERLPTELLTKIIYFVAERQTTRSYKILENLPGNANSKRIRVNLTACLFVSQRLHIVALPFIYRDPNVTRFQKFSLALESRPDLGRLVRSLDISQFRATIPHTAIRSCLFLTPILRKCRLMLEDLADEEVLKLIFNGMRNLEVLEIETCYPSARDEWRIPDLIHNFFKGSPRSAGATITSLTCNLREVPCARMFEAMLPNMPNLRILDVAQTDITCKALRRIPKTARLTHLDVTYCGNLPGAEFTHFFVSHPAVKDSLITLLASNVSCSGRLLTEYEVAMILAHAPPTLRALNLGYSEMNQTHLPYLRKLSGQLEELGVGRNLYLRDVEDIVLSRRYNFHAEDHNIDAWRLLEGGPGCESILGPMKDAVAICKLRRRLHSVSPKPCRQPARIVSKIRYLDVSSIPPQEQGKIKESVLWAEESMPLKVIEISGAKKDNYSMLPRLCSAVGWRNRWIDGRVWVERM